MKENQISIFSGKMLFFQKLFKIRCNQNPVSHQILFRLICQGLEIFTVKNDALWDKSIFRMACTASKIMCLVFGVTVWGNPQIVRLQKRFAVEFGVKTPAEVVSVGKDGTLQLKAGILKMKAKVDEVRLIEDDERAARKKTPSVTIRQNADRALRASAARELDIRGMETLEAESVVENFISAAVMGKLETVTIIHGKGTGALRKAVHDILRRNKAVKSFRLGVYGEGESGVTVVTLK